MINSKKFYDRVSGKLPLAQNGSVNIVFLGDSVTHGCFSSGYGVVGHDRFASYTMKFHKMLSILFPSTVFNIINSGIGGDSASMGYARLERDVIAYHPDLVVVSFGLNDHSNLEGNLAALGKIFDRLNLLDIPCVYLSENMMNTSLADDIEQAAGRFVDYAKVTAVLQTDGTMDNLFESYMALARSKGVTVCDVYSKWKKLHECGANITMLLANRINHPTRDMHDFTAFSLINTLFFE